LVDEKEGGKQEMEFKEKAQELDVRFLLSLLRRVIKILPVAISNASKPKKIPYASQPKIP
jgi:hypothetical protein